MTNPGKDVPLSQLDSLSNPCQAPSAKEPHGNWARIATCFLVKDDGQFVAFQQPSAMEYARKEKRIEIY